MNNKIQIPKIDKQASELSHNKNRILPVYGINQQGHSPADAEIPESDRKYAFLLALALEPLHYKSR